MKKYNAGLPSVGFNKSEVLPIRLKPSFTILLETVLLYSLKLPILFSTIEFHNIPYHFTEIRALDIVGDYEFFTEKQPRLVTLTTLEDSLCLVIPAAEYMTWLRSDSHALFLRSRMIITQLVAQAQFQRQNLFADNRTRMLVFLKEQVTQAVNDSTHTENSNGNPNPGSVYPIRIPFTRPEIAAHLGCSVRTVNRTVQELVDEEIIHLNKGKIWISEKQASTFL